MTDAEKMLAQAHREREAFLSGLGAVDPVLAGAIGSGSYGGVFDFFKPKGTSGGPDFSSEPTLKAGSAQTDSILRLQESLLDLGYDLGSFGPDKNGVDGKFTLGGQTDKAVKAFQSDQGLPSNGIVDQATWSALSAALGKTGKTGTKITAETGLQALTAGLQFGTTLASGTKKKGPKKKGKGGKGGGEAAPSGDSGGGSVFPLLIGGVVVIGLVGAGIYFATRQE